MAFIIVGCAAGGEELTQDMTPDFDPNSPQCMACADTLEAESAACAVDGDACTRDMDVEVVKQCFRDEGACQEAALDRAAICHQACGDDPQANVETCAGDCFVTRAECYEVIVEVLVQCYDICTDVVTCAVCDASFGSGAETCDDQLQDCADTCVRTHRPDG